MIYYNPFEVLKNGRRVEPSFPGEKPNVEEGQILAGLIEDKDYYFSPDLTDHKDFNHYLSCYNMDYYFGMRFYVLESNGFEKSEKPIKASSKDITKIFNEKRNN